MSSSEWWLVGFGLRCCTLLAVELGCFLFVVPTLFNLHRDAADVGAAGLALVGVVGGLATVHSLTRELSLFLSDKDQ